MSKTGLSLLFLVVGLVVGTLAGHLIFRGSPSGTSARETQQQNTVPEGASHVDQFYYRMNDSMASRHTISVSDSGLSHTVDTVRIERK